MAGTRQAPGERSESQRWAPKISIIRSVLRNLIVSVRPHQWTKNLFVFAPLAFSQKLGEPESITRGLLAFVVFTATAGAVYLVNDLLDRDRDRLHPLKRNRPLAAGTLTAGVAIAAAVGLVALSAAGALYLGTLFTLILGSYLAINALYSIALKKVVIIDVMLVAFGFVLRVEAGAAAITVEVSAWLLLCTTFVALLLVFSKRRHELLLLPESATAQREVLADYSLSFLDQMISVATASTLLSYALYAVADETVDKFGTDALIYTMPLVLFGIFRYLFLVYHVESEHSPTEAMLRDPPFLLSVLLWMAAIIGIIYFVP